MEINLDKVIRSISIALDLSEMSSLNESNNIIEDVTNINYSEHKFIHHAQRTAYISVEIASKLNLPEDKQKLVYIASLLHDIGAANFLSISHSSNTFIHEHCVIGANTTKNFPFFGGLSDVILYHHENIDGTGAMKISGKIIALVEKGKKLFEKNEIKEAFKVFEEAINLDENYAETYIVKAEAHIGMYEMEEACQCIKKYLTFVPKSKRAYLDLIEIYDATAEFEKAIFYCNELLKEDNKNAELYFKKADFYDMLGENEEALNCCDDCLKLKPDYYDALCLKGSLLNALDRNTESLEAYSKAIEVDKTNSKAYLEKALVYKDMDNYHTALEYAKKAYELDPEDEWCKCQYSIMKSMFL